MKTIISFLLLFLISAPIYSMILENCGDGYSKDIELMLKKALRCDQGVNPISERNIANIFNNRCKKIGCHRNDIVFEITNELFIDLPAPTTEERRQSIVDDLTCKNKLASTLKGFTANIRNQNGSEGQISRNCFLRSNSDLIVNKLVRNTDPNQVPAVAGGENTSDCIYLSHQVIYPKVSFCGNTPACVATVYCPSLGQTGTATCKAPQGQCPDVSKCIEPENSAGWIDPLKGRPNTTVNPGINKTELR